MSCMSFFWLKRALPVFSVMRVQEFCLFSGRVLFLSGVTGQTDQIHDKVLGKEFLL